MCMHHPYPDDSVYSLGHYPKVDKIAGLWWGVVQGRELCTVPHQRPAGALKVFVLQLHKTVQSWPMSYVQRWIWALDNLTHSTHCWIVA